MAGVKSLRRIQLGAENTAGTAVQATALWRGMGTISDDREVVFVEEDIGVFSGGDRAYVPMLAGSITFEETPATFEQAPYIFAAGVKNVVSGTQDTGGSGYIYTYTFPTTSLNTVQSYTVEGGDNQQEEEFYYGVVEAFAMNGEGGGPLNISADWIGQQVQDGTFSTMPSVPSVEEVLFSKGKLYIDDSGGTIGNTQVTDTLLSASLDVDTGILRKWTADGSLDFSFIQYTRPEVTLELTYEHNATAVTEKGKWRSEAVRLVRLDFEGGSLTTAGSSHSVKLLRIDLAGKYEDFGALEDQDGNDIVTATFRGLYSSTDSLFAEIKVVNENTSLT